jgi:DDE family transposase
MTPRSPSSPGCCATTSALTASPAGPPTCGSSPRRENPHPGAQLSPFEQHAGKRYQVIATHTPTGGIQFRQAAHRTHARVEDRIRYGNNTGLVHLPSRDYAINQAWCTAVSPACDLLAWLRLLALSGDLAKAEPTTLHYRLLHTAAHIGRGPRRRRLTTPETRPWTHDLHHHHPPTTLTSTHQPNNPTEPTRTVEPAPTRHDSRAPHPTRHPVTRSTRGWVEASNQMIKPVNRRG